MMINEAIKKFIEENIDKNPDVLRLKYSGHKTKDFDYEFAITQIECRKKAKQKLPEFISENDFIFPSTLSAEQSTSELLASFHSTLLNASDSVLDLTCGLGIDSMTFSHHCKSVTSIDRNPDIVNAVLHNISVLDIHNMDVILSDSIDYLKCTQFHWNKIFVDPARRSVDNKRTFAFKDCSPDILAYMPLIKEHCDQLIIKSSPMLDITQSLRELKNVTDVWILSVKNECKELLFRIDFTFSFNNRTTIHALNFAGGVNNEFEVDFSEISNSQLILYNDDANELVNRFLYEPNSSVMKIACWDTICNRFNGLEKLGSNTHIFVSSTLYKTFPGRILRIKSIVSPKSKSIKSFAKNKFNVCVRNFPENADSLKRRLKVSDGGSDYLYAVRIGAESKPKLIVAEPIKE